MRLAAALLLAGFAAACGGADAPTAALAPELGRDGAIAMSADVGAVPGAPAGATVVRGLVVPARKAGLRFAVPGTVETVEVEVGQRVRRGAVLATLETESRQAKLAQARDIYGRARATDPSVETSNGPPPRWLEEEVRELLEGVREEAKKNPGDVAAVRRRAERDGEEAAAELAISIARERARASGMSSATRARKRAGETALARAVVSDLKQRINQLEYAIRESELTAPFDGLVLYVGAEPGRPWNTRDLEAAVELVDPTSYQVRAPVEARVARELQSGARAWVAVPPHLGGGTLAARVHGVSSQDVPMVDEVGGVESWWREVTFELPDDRPDGLLPGDELSVAFE